MRYNNKIWSIAGILIAGMGIAVAGLSVAPEPIEADAKAHQTGVSAPMLQLAELLLLDDSILPDEENPTGEVTDQANVKRAKQEKPKEGGNVQTKQIGEETNSQVTGQVRASGVVDNLQQSQSGRANTQSVGVGSVKDSHIVGNVNVSAHVHQVDQGQAGESNQQGISVGELR
jgi:hypothetical protein